MPRPILHDDWPIRLGENRPNWARKYLAAKQACIINFLRSQTSNTKLFLNFLNSRVLLFIINLFLLRKRVFE